MARLRANALLWLGRIGWSIAGVVVTGFYLYYLQAQSMPDLQFWHRKDVAAAVVPELDRPSQAGLQDYIVHEAEIFRQLAARVDEYSGDLPLWHRYNAATFTGYQTAWPQGNRTQLKVPDNKVGAALLVHGLSDSTHSMVATADTLLEAGFETLNLRMPGHGTLPGALRNVNWRQFRGAYLLGVKHLARELAPGQPLVLVGYSNGAALAVDYTLRALLAEGELSRPDLLILISPAMQVSPLAAYARIQRWISELPGMEKLGWTDVVPEFDPFKYNSFPVYAGEQIYHLTSRLASNLEKLNSDQRENFPPVLAFQSVVDATIPPRSIVDSLLDRTANTGAQLVLFDVNRAPGVSSLLVNTGADFLDSLESRPSLPFDLSLVGSASGDPQKISVKHRKRGEDSWRETSTELRWPGPVFSLSHIALPFAPDDPIYGRDRGDGLLRLGDLWLKGERGVFGVPLGLLARQRYNPFHPYQQQRIIEALERVRENQSSTP